ncbi:unnamed protein product [Brachionus calyciflorus]|uniref:Uncharacterized protein n=1 Tax=Brachionus calyciflorus TaxID=104777 RepID=A0A813MB53_9BILA|nr:unnamed protein product [Brachionus calyciflorus]
MFKKKNKAEDSKQDNFVNKNESLVDIRKGLIELNASIACNISDDKLDDLFGQLKVLEKQFDDHVQFKQEIKEKQLNLSMNFLNSNTQQNRSVNNQIDELKKDLNNFKNLLNKN